MGGNIFLFKEREGQLHFPVSRACFQYQGPWQSPKWTNSAYSPVRRVSISPDPATTVNTLVGLHHISNVKMLNNALCYLDI